MDNTESEDDDIYDLADEDSKIPNTDALMTVVDMPQTDQFNAGLESEGNNGSEDEESVNGQLENNIEVQHTGKRSNGQRVFDSTPPELLLQKIEKKISKNVMKKETDTIVPDLIRCTVLARLGFSDRHWRLARAHVKLASAYFDLKGYSAQAVYHIEIAETVMRNIESPRDDYSTEQPLIFNCLVEMYFTLGRALIAEKKFSDAETALNQAEKILKQLSVMASVLDTEIEEWSMKLNLALGRLNFCLKKYALSISYYEQALDVMKKMYGSKSNQLISVYQSLGRVEQGKGRQADHQRAIEHFMQAHTIAVANFQSDGVEVADTAYAVALSYANVGDELAESSAEVYLNQTLNIYESHYGSSNEKVLEVKDELARLMIRTDRVEDAITLMQSSLEHKQDTFGDLSAQVADTWKLIGNCYLSNGEADRALQALKKCYTIECSVLGINSRKSKDTQKTIDLLLANPNLAARQKKSKAEELKDRPRFNSVSRMTTALGGFKPQL